MTKQPYKIAYGLSHYCLSRIHNSKDRFQYRKQTSRQPDLFGQGVSLNSACIFRGLKGLPFIDKITAQK
jgi:hypothetical protein